MKILPAIFYLPARFSQVTFLKQKFACNSNFDTGGGGGGYMKTTPYFIWGKKKGVEQPFPKHNSNSFLPSTNFPKNYQNLHFMFVSVCAVYADNDF
jgi:hypothetical protein